jgi:hypothetical protein
MSIAELKTIMDLIVSIVAVIGIPFTIWRYFVNEAKRRQLETDALHVEVNNKYLDYLVLAAAHPNLGVCDGPEHRAAVSLKSDEDKVRQWFLFSYLTSTLERAFYLTRWSSAHRKDVEEEWASWERYIADYFRNENYRRYWEEVTASFTKQTSFGPAFENYMRGQYDPKTPKLP